MSVNGVSACGDGAAPSVDPDPFTLVALILSTVSTAAGVYAAALSRHTLRSQRRERHAQVIAAVHRWEANLIELKELLLEIETFAQEMGIEDSAQEEKPVLSPLQIPLELMPDKLKKYKSLLAALYGKAKELNNDAFSLLDKLHDDQARNRLRQSAVRIRSSLSELAKMKSVRSAIKIAISTVDDILRDANGIRSQLSEQG
jgi:hypothetical protein